MRWVWDKWSKATRPDSPSALMSPDASAPVAAETGLLQLPPDALRRIWDLLHDKQDLRRTCRSLRTAIDAWACSLNIKLCHAWEDLPGGPRYRWHRRTTQLIANTALEAAQDVLATFPSAAKLTKLSWQLFPSSAGAGGWPEPDGLRMFLHHSQARLTALTCLDISLGPVSAIVHTAKAFTRCHLLTWLTTWQVSVSQLHSFKHTRPGESSAWSKLTPSIRCAASSPPILGSLLCADALSVPHHCPAPASKPRRCIPGHRPYRLIPYSS